MWVTNCKSDLPAIIKLFDFLLSFFLSKEARASLIGDTLEEYKEISTNYHGLRAEIWVYKQVFISTIFFTYNSFILGIAARMAIFVQRIYSPELAGLMLMSLVAGVVFFPEWRRAIETPGLVNNSIESLENILPNVSFTTQEDSKSPSSRAARESAGTRLNRNTSRLTKPALHIIAVVNPESIIDEAKEVTSISSNDDSKTFEPPVSEERTAVIPPQPIIVRRRTDEIRIPIPDEKNDKDTIPMANEKDEKSVYGYRRDPFTGRAKFHSGVDIKAAWGDPVGASHPGTVQFAGWYHGYGNLMIVNHGGGITTYYGHLSRFEREVGDKVERGTIIGQAGSTGRATSPRLHYEVRLDGNAVNPLQPLALDPSSEFFK